MKFSVDDSGAEKAIKSFGKMHVNFRAIAAKSIRDSLIQAIISDANKNHKTADDELRRKVAIISAMMWKRAKEKGVEPKFKKGGWNPTKRYWDGSGELSRSIYIDNIRLRGSIMEYDLLSNVPYALHVEFGTEHSNPFPFIRPAVDRNIKKIRDKLQLDTKKLFSSISDLR